MIFFLFCVPDMQFFYFFLRLYDDNKTICVLSLYFVIIEKKTTQPLDEQLKMHITKKVKQCINSKSYILMKRSAQEDSNKVFHNYSINNASGSPFRTWLVTIKLILPYI